MKPHAYSVHCPPGGLSLVLERPGTADRAVTGAVPYRFTIYIAGQAVNSAQALANLQALCRGHLAGRPHIEVIDVFRDPERALADRIFMTPTLVRQTPPPLLRIVRTLTDTATLMKALGLPEDRTLTSAES